MNKPDRKAHWEKIYQNKQFNEMSWYQMRPDISLRFLALLDLPKSAKIIDVGGGDGHFVDYLIREGFEDITVLDVSENALKRARERLGIKGENVKWILADAASFEPTEKYDFWHDRASFHFLLEEHEVQHYIETVKQSINIGGHLVIGTFSENGPEKCSGLAIKQYSERAMSSCFKDGFEKISCEIVDHFTPSGSEQQFIFCHFKRTSTF